MIDRLSGVDVLLKTPQGLRPPHHGRYAADSTTAWLEQYEGGWQEIFPNGGDANHAYGVELSFHGESSLMPYRYQVIQAEGETVIVDFSVKLYRTPLQYCWLWQEMHASQGFPFFYGGVYTLALEPWTSYPGQGLSRVRESTQTQRTLGAGESLSAALSLVTFPAPQAMNLSHITLAGEVRPKEVMLLS